MTVRRNETDAFRLADSRIYVGISAWTEPTLIESGRFYPCDAKTPETRLRYYATEFPIIEIDSTFYAPPSEHIAQIWADRTPSGFIFDVKSYRLLTHHPTAPSSLWRELRDELPPTLRAKPTSTPRISVGSFSQTSSIATWPASGFSWMRADLARCCSSFHRTCIRHADRTATSNGSPLVSMMSKRRSNSVKVDGWMTAIVYPHSISLLRMALRT